MAFTQQELKQWQPIIASAIEEQRPPEKVRPQLDIGYTIEDQSIIIYTIRPKWNQPEEKMKTSTAKVTWVRNQQLWKVYWQPADMKWHSYDPMPQVNTLDEFFEELKEDPKACFWG
ncbi:DUF3024 domain-containing protein [Fodinibius sp. SL11]|uniref:DUF3024 domain-containing protein n=1 Tax=Fodinibius sp. SL11 TaxID=3425690 RepID=UPI003F884589